MDTLNKNKLLVWAIIVLLVINIGTLTTFWVASQGHNRNNDKSKFRSGRIDEGILVNELKLTDEQIGFYKNARKKHFTETRQLRDKIEDNHRIIHDELFSDKTDTLRINILADSIGLINAEFEKANFNHFLILKSQLSPEQCKKFKELMDEASMNIQRNDHREHNKK
jgi:Spy/CpxP family protein refolding chaperone